MIKAFKYRLYPNTNQVRELEIMLETHRRLYNECLAQRKERYETAQESVKYTQQSAWFKSARGANDWYARLNFSSAQATMRRLDKAFQAFFRRIKTGDKPGYPRYQKEALRRLGVVGRAVSRKKKGSRNRGKAVSKLRSIHARVSNKRGDHHHKVARDFVSRYAFIAAESLTVKNMVSNRRLRRSISDAGWSQFLNILRAKADSAGSVFVEVPPQGTSQACSGCGALVRKALSVRQHRCPECGLSLQRDVNAARNILARGQARMEPVWLNVAH